MARKVIMFFAVLFNVNEYSKADTMQCINKLRSPRLSEPIVKKGPKFTVPTGEESNWFNRLQNSCSASAGSTIVNQFCSNHPGVAYSSTARINTVTVSGEVSVKVFHVAGRCKEEKQPENPCPDGTITTPASKTDPWYGITIDIPKGVTRRYCAPVMPPIVLGHPNGIAISWYDVSDQDCGQLNVRVDGPNPLVNSRGGTGFSSSGVFYYYAQVGPRSTPEQTSPGNYVITVTGNSDTCNRFRLAWRVY